MNLSVYICTIAEAGVALSGESAQVSLNLLLDIENILDKGRMYCEPAEVPTVNEKMDTLRSRIRDRLDAMSQEEAREFMVERGRQLKKLVTGPVMFMISQTC